MNVGLSTLQYVLVAVNIYYIRNTTRAAAIRPTNSPRNTQNKQYIYIYI